MMNSFFKCFSELFLFLCVCVCVCVCLCVCVYNMQTYRYNLQFHKSQPDSDRENQELIWWWINISVLYFIDFCFRCVGNTFVNVQRSSHAHICLLDTDEQNQSVRMSLKTTRGDKRENVNTFTSAHQWCQICPLAVQTRAALSSLKKKRPCLCSSNF